MDNFLSGLFGGQDDDAPEARQQRAHDFVQRVERGNPAEDVSTEEVVHNYKNVASQLPDNEYVDAAREALTRFSPQQRQEFGQLLNQQTGATIKGDIDDPQEIAQVTNQLRSSGGGGLAGLLGGGGGDDLMNAISGLIGGGGGSAQTHEQGGMSDLLRNPIVKAIMAAIAAMAMKKYAGGAGGGLGGIFGGDESARTQPQTRPGTRPAREAPRRTSDKSNDNDGGGGILDALFGGGDDDQDDHDKRDRSDILKRKDKPQSI